MRKRNSSSTASWSHTTIICFSAGILGLAYLPHSISKGGH